MTGKNVSSEAGGGLEVCFVGVFTDFEKAIIPSLDAFEFLMINFTRSYQILRKEAHDQW